MIEHELRLPLLLGRKRISKTLSRDPYCTCCHKALMVPLGAATPQITRPRYVTVTGEDMQRRFVSARGASAALRYKSLRPLGALPIRLPPTTPLLSTKYKHIHSMAANIVLPTLTAWAEQGLTALFNAKDQSTFDDAFDAFVAADTGSIVVNGQSLTRAQYKEQISKDKILERGADVQFLGAVSVPKDENNPFDVCMQTLSART